MYCNIRIQIILWSPERVFIQQKLKKIQWRRRLKTRYKIIVLLINDFSDDRDSSVSQT